MRQNGEPGVGVLMKGRLGVGQEDGVHEHVVRQGYADTESNPQNWAQHRSSKSRTRQLSD